MSGGLAGIGRDDLVIVVAPVGGQRVDGDTVKLRSAALMIDWMMQASPTLVVVSVPASSQRAEEAPERDLLRAHARYGGMAPSAVPIKDMFHGFLPRFGVLCGPGSSLASAHVMAWTT
jgi:hypothetical protein